MNSSIKKGQDIAALVARLVYKTNIEMTALHWIRIAFLVRYTAMEVELYTHSFIAAVFNRLQSTEEEGGCTI